MDEWICVKPTVWGNEKGKSRMWKTGEKIKREDRPNQHFKTRDEINGIFGSKPEARFNFMAKPAKDWVTDDFNLATKPQINEKFQLGMAESKVLTTNKKNMIAEAINKTRYGARE